jgi:hypothetical protein
MRHHSTTGMEQDRIDIYRNSYNSVTVKEKDGIDI